MNDNYRNIPQAMRVLKNWVLFKIVERGNGKKTKPPYQPNGTPAKANDPNTWSSFDAVAAVMKKQPGRYAGIGFQFDDTPFTGIDIDHCIDDRGNLSELAQEILQETRSYAEYSPSGHGLHIIIKGKLKDRRGGKNASLGLEMYDSKRYFTMTGNTVQGYEHISSKSEAIEAVYRLYDKYQIAKGKQPQGEGTKEQARPAAVISSPVADDTAAVIIERIRKSQQGALFTSLFDSGDLSAYGGDHSSADMALMNILPFWCRGNAQMMEEIFSMSALARREKWQRVDYRQNTIQKALDGWDRKAYDPGYRTIKPIEHDNIKDKEFTQYQLSDTGNAERLKKVYGDDLLYCLSAERWLKWDGCRWCYCVGDDPIELYPLFVSVMRESACQYTKILDSESVKAVKAFFRRSENKQNISNGLKCARSLFTVDIKELDSNDWLLNCKNGTIDLKTGQLMKHDRKHLITCLCNTDYKPAARSELWENTLKQIIPDDDIRRWIQKAIGYTITGSTREEKIFCLYGEGGGGKGTFIETIAKIFSEYSTTIPIDTLLASRNDAGNGQGATPQIAKLINKRLALTSESGKDRRFKDDTIKQLSGGDMITARRLYGEPVEFPPHFALWMSTNYKPNVTDATDKGMIRRLIIIPFNANLAAVRDNTLKEKLLQPQEREGILKWCVDGCLMWLKEGLDDIPAAIKKLMQDYFEDNDTIGQFIDECCTVDPNSRIKGGELLNAYNSFLGAGARWRGVKLQSFKQDMQRRGFEYKRFNAGRYFLGLKLNEEAKEWANF